MFRRVLFGLLFAGIVGYSVNVAVAKMDPSLVGWWQFDEGKGEAIADSSGHGNNGTVFGITSWVDGFVGSKALKITGGGVTIADKAELRPPQLTVAMWFNFSGKQVPAARLFQKGKDNHETINFQGGEGGVHFSLAVAKGENRGVGTKQRFEIGKWYHITGVYDGSEVRVYVDGKISSKETVGSFVPYDAGQGHPLVIGNRYEDMARPFNGIVDDVRVYTRPLSDAQVWELYAWKGRPPVVAAIPEPAEEASGVMPSQKLSWTPAKGASEHLVYLGTNADKVAKATKSSSEFKGAVKTTSFDPGKFDFGGTYYWRVDEKTNTGISKGDVWKFQVLSGKASNPSPNATLRNVATDAKLSWTQSDLATSHELYFGDNLEEVKNATASSKVFKGKFALGNEKFDPGPLKKGKFYYWRVDEKTSLGTAKGNLWRFRTKGDDLVLQVDLAVKTCDNKELYPGLAKPGWTIWASNAWSDMYMHDHQVFPLKADGSLDEAGIDGTGVTLWMTTGSEGQLGIGAKGICRDNLGGGGCPSGTAEGDPIANSWAYGVDWVGPYAGDILLVIQNLPAGVYDLYSYHNFWEPCTQKTRNCLDCVCGMPPMPSVTANPLYSQLLSLDANGVPLGGKHSYKAALPEGTGKGVKAIQNAYNVAPQHVYKDEELIPSYVKFETDGSPVLIIYQADRSEPLYPDCARPGREGARGILNAFELIQVETK
ncbi:MAG: LamG domain-containing protein [Planctomycetota bacterium]|jgi:hypothetical protein